MTVVGVIEEEEDEESDNEEGGMAEKKGKTKTRKGERELKVHKNRLLDAFFKKVTEVYEIRNTKDKKVELKNTPFKNIQLIAEKAHNKFHTRLSGLEPFGVDWDKLSSHFQNKYATSCTLADLPGKNGGKVCYLNIRNLPFRAPLSAKSRSSLLWRWESQKT